MAKHSHSIILPEGKTLDTIEWRSVPGVAAYEVSEYGHIRRIAAARGTWAGKVLRPQVHNDGYARYTLRQANKWLTVLAHRQVLLAFTGTPPAPGMCAAHWDGVRSNNHVNNLRWATSLENSADARRHGTVAVGEDIGTSVFTEAEVIEIRKFHRNNPHISRRAIAREYAVAHTTINKIVNGLRWKHI